MSAAYEGEDEAWQKNCIVHTSPWSPCSKTCGLGISTRISNDNEQCRLLKESRLCNMRPCEVDITQHIKVGMFLCAPLGLDSESAFVWQHSGLLRLPLYMDLLCCTECQNVSCLCWYENLSLRILAPAKGPGKGSQAKPAVLGAGSDSPVLSWQKSSAAPLVHGYELSYASILLAAFGFICLNT